MSGPNFLHRPFANPRESFPRDGNGFVDLNAYSPYLVDNPDNVPLIVSRDPSDITSFVYQHVYFQKRFYKQDGEDPRIVDEILSQFCTSPYNLIAMRHWMEQLLHSDYEEHVIAPDPEYMRAALVDFQSLDFLGASVIGKRVSLVPEALDYIVPGSGNAPASGMASPQERAGFFDTLAEGMLNRLALSSTAPEHVINGAIKRMSRIVNSEVLDREVDTRIGSNVNYFPVGIRHPAVYYQYSIDILKDASLMDDNNKRFSKAVGMAALHTGVNGLELAA